MDKNKTYVVHIKKHEYDIYIGRPSKWQNPYTHKSLEKTLASEQVSTRGEAIEKYETYLKESGLINDIDELKGKILGCWCCKEISDGSEPNFVCHGQVLARIINQEKKDNQIQLI
jgi:hypothetical protein